MKLERSKVVAILVSLAYGYVAATLLLAVRTIGLTCAFEVANADNVFDSWLVVALTPLLFAFLSHGPSRGCFGHASDALTFAALYLLLIAAGYSATTSDRLHYWSAIVVATLLLVSSTVRAMNADRQKRQSDQTSASDSVDDEPETNE